MHIQKKERKKKKKNIKKIKNPIHPLIKPILNRTIPKINS